MSLMSRLAGLFVPALGLLGGLVVAVPGDLLWLLGKCRVVLRSCMLVGRPGDLSMPLVLFAVLECPGRLWSCVLQLPRRMPWPGNLLSLSVCLVW